MNKLNAETLRSQKAFRLSDLIVYALVSIAVIALFLCLGRGKKGELESFAAEVDGKAVLSFTFSAGSPEVLSEEAEIISNDGKTLVIKISAGGGYNEITVDKIKRSVYVSGADCSTRKDCVHSKKITRAGESIICAPHKLVIRGGGVSDPVTG